jgi:hypothetical protein
MLKHGLIMLATKDEHVERLWFAFFANFVWILLWHVRKHQIFTTYYYH